MEAAALLRMVASLGLVLGTLAVALWAVRRFDLRLPGRQLTQGRLAVVERISLDPKRSVVLLRRDGREHLVLLAPEGATVLESNIRRTKAQSSQAFVAPSERRAPHAVVPSFASLLEQHLGFALRDRRPADNRQAGDTCDAR